MKLAEDSKSRYAIVVSESADVSAVFAVHELQRYLKKISGATLEVVRSNERIGRPSIFVGRVHGDERIHDVVQGADLGEDGFLIRTLGNDLFLMGGEKGGVLYSVYNFLERLGVSWLDPSLAGERVPLIRDLCIGQMDMVERPSFKYRGFVVYYEGNLYKESFFGFIDWMGKNRLNHIFLNGGGGPLGWQDLVHDGIAERFVSETRKRGIRFELGGHTWLTAPYGLGKVTQEKYTSLVNGTRGGSFPHQICFAHKEVFDIIASNFRNYAREHSAADVFAFWFGDGVNNWCECDVCVKKPPTDWYVMVTNRLAGELYMIDPTKKLAVLLYSNVLEPPRTVHLNDRYGNLVLCFAVYGRRLDRPLSDETCRLESSIHFWPEVNKVVFPLNGDYCRLLEQWRRIYDGEMYVYDYYGWEGAGPRRRTFMKHFPPIEVVAEDVKYLSGKKINGVVLDQKNLQFWPSGLNMRANARLFWNAELSAEGLKEEYWDESFAGASPQMKKYFSQLSEALDESDDDVQPTERIQRSIARLLEAQEYLKEAEDMRNDQDVCARIRRVRLHFEYVKMLKTTYLYESKGEYREALKWVQKIEAFIESNRETLRDCISLDLELALVYSALTKLMRSKQDLAEGKQVTSERPISWWDDPIPASLDLSNRSR